ncbi:hypothetical protein K0038_00259 [Pseudomonas syringae]|uniref:hypothetical protein n=1 Tax=Pseudomonas syringae TaxID=317 RepID=UPI001CA9DFA9|nr:hypothetical protein [Pseudomonas syringae]MCI3943269.1 hypothetical protein [Pseudomonas syringae]
MNFPSTDDFLEEFGIKPTEVDPSMALYRYIVKSKNIEFEVDISFSAIMKSFQIILRLETREFAIISSENVDSIKLTRDSSGAGIHVLFDICESTSEARVIFEPELSCRWWTLRNA